MIDIEAAMDWLIVHAEDSEKTSSLSEAGEGNNEIKPSNEQVSVAKSFKCDEYVQRDTCILDKRLSN